MIPDDLSNFERPGFFIFTPEEAGVCLGLIVAGLFLYDILERLLG